MNKVFLMNNNIKCVILFKSWFFKFCKKEKICSENLELSPHGCREPDLALIINSCIFILEFKHQGRSGSVSEKLQTSLFKQNYYRQVCSNHKVFYIYILSPWFRNNCEAELVFLKKEKIFFFFSDTD